MARVLQEALEKYKIYICDDQYGPNDIASTLKAYAGTEYTVTRLHGKPSEKDDYTILVTSAETYNKLDVRSINAFIGKTKTAFIIVGQPDDESIPEISAGSKASLTRAMNARADA